VISDSVGRFAIMFPSHDQRESQTEIL